MKKDNKENYWFKRRRYGFGWIPATWQGWLTIVMFLAVVFGSMVILQDAPRNEFSIEIAIYLLIVLIDIAALLLIGYKKGPAPKWRWGKSDNDDLDKDF